MTPEPLGAAAATAADQYLFLRGFFGAKYRAVPCRYIFPMSSSYVSDCRNIARCSYLFRHIMREDGIDLSAGFAASD